MEGRLQRRPGFLCRIIRRHGNTENRYSSHLGRIVIHRVRKPSYQCHKVISTHPIPPSFALQQAIKPPPISKCFLPTFLNSLNIFSLTSAILPSASSSSSSGLWYHTSPTRPCTSFHPGIVSPGAELMNLMSALLYGMRTLPLEKARR